MDVKTITQSLNLKPNRQSYQGDCPVCGYLGAFSLRENSGRLLVYCHASGCSWDDFVDILQRLGHFNNRSCISAKVANPAKTLSGGGFQRYSKRESCYSMTKRDNALKLWTESISAQGTVVEKYLRGRNIHIPLPASIRFLPEAWHKSSEQNLPVMIARVEQVGQSELVGIHRTFLSLTGESKADVSSNKMMLGSVLGGSVHLAEPEDRLAITEGIETGLSVQQETGIPTWAALSCAGMKALILPEWVREVLIFADNDHEDFKRNVGLKTAYEAAGQWSARGIQVQVVKPDSVGVDFNNLL